MNRFFFTLIFVMLHHSLFASCQEFPGSGGDCFFYYHNSTSGDLYGHLGTVTWTVTGGNIQNGSSRTVTNWNPGTHPAGDNWTDVGSPNPYFAFNSAPYLTWTITVSGSAYDGSWMLSGSWSGTPNPFSDCSTSLSGFGVGTFSGPPPDEHLKPNDVKTCPNPGPTNEPPPRMARYSAHLMLASLNIEDTPFGYIPARGPAIDFRVAYNQRELAQPTTFSYSNLGPNWTFNWLSYVTDDPGNPSAAAGVYVRGGGTEKYAGFNSTTQSYAPDAQSQAVLVRTNSAPITYEKRYSDGSKEVYSLSDNSNTFPRKIFMTQVVDPSGNAVTVGYDSSFRNTSLTDALGKVTTLSYELSGDPLKITKITEPFSTGRTAIFSYTNGQLTTITDEIGIQSQFHYMSGTNFIDSLTTPYGTSSFATGQTGSNAWVEMTDPLGGKERIEYRDNAPGIAATESVVPSASGLTNDNLNVANSFYWDKKATLMYPPVNGVYDYTKAHITHWTYNSDGSLSGISGSEKAPLENRVWYTHTGQLDSNHAGSSSNPSQIARVLDNTNPSGSTQIWQYEYNSFGKVTKITDPASPHRVSSFQYDSNNIDLLNAYQQRSGGASTDPFGASADKIASYASYVGHKPQNVTDAAGQTTTYVYNSYGQVQSTANAKGETTSYGYGDGSSAKPIGYLVSITSPTFSGSSAVTSFTYDGARRVQSETYQPDNYTVTTSYDNLDRPAQITYPDGTTRQFQYSQDFGQGLKTILDLTGSKDRRGRWTTRHYNRNRQMDSITDPLSRTTLYNWCTCGALTSIEDARHKVTTFNRDLQSRVYQKVFADGTTLNYLYEGQTTANTAGTTSRLKSMTDAKNAVTNYQYFTDDNIQQISSTDTSGQPLSPATPTVNFTYDPNYNRVANMVDGTGTTLYDYYAVGSTATLGATELHTVDGPLTNDTITYSYDELGRRLSSSINGITSSVTYDSLGRLDTSDNVLGHFSRVYDGSTHVTPRLQTVNFPNGQTSNYSYFDNSSNHRLQTLQYLRSGSANVSKFDYTYDSEGRISPTWTKQLSVSPAVTSDLTYDLADQLTAVQDTVPGNPPTSFSYGYDFAGNRTSDSVTGYSVNDMNEITNSGYTYDLNGNMTSDGVRGFEWDAANRLTAIIHPGNAGRSEFTYDGLNRRVQITEKNGSGQVQKQSQFVWDGMALAEERNSGTVVKRFLPDGVQVTVNSSPNTKLFYSRDHLGSIRSLTNETGTLLGTLDYDAYGSISRAPVPANTSSNGPVITGAVSRLTHGSAGDFDITLPLSGAPGIEMRKTTGGNYTLILSFDRPVVSGTATIASGVGTVNGLPSFSGSTATVQLSGVSDRQTITVELDNVAGVTGLTDKVLLAMSVLIGDADQNGAVTIDDIKLIQAANGHRVDGSCFKCDINLNGFIDSGDVFLGTKYFGQDAALFPDFAFTGHYYHSRSGLYLAPYRAYNPSLGRWISRDPIGEYGGINLYAYVGNSPLNRIDPLGLWDINLLPWSDPFHGAGDLTPLSPDQLTVGGHGGPSSMIDSNGNDLSPTKLADLIRNNPKYDPNKPVRLEVCQTGRQVDPGALPFGQQLANALGSDVLAPTGNVILSPSGNTWLRWGYYQRFYQQKP
jgi:RHS repeat-associated protein